MSGRAAVAGIARHPREAWWWWWLHRHGWVQAATGDGAGRGEAASAFGGDVGKEGGAC